MEAQRHVSLQVFLQHLFFLPSVTFTRSRSSFYCGGHCIPMSYKSSLKSSCSNVQLIRTIHFAVLRHMLLSILVQPCSHIVSKTWHQSSCGPYIFTSIGIFYILHIVSKRSKSFRQSNSCNYSFVGASCLLFSFTRASSHLIAIITPTITIVMGYDESGKPMESSSPQSQINTRYLHPGYHNVCSKQWQGNSSCVDMMLLQLRFPETWFQ